MKVVLAHSLKPPNENRINLKLGFALIAIPNLTITILGADGFDSAPSDMVPGIKYIPLFPKRSRGVVRLLNLVRFWIKLKEEKPEVIICCSPDLLAVSVLAKILFGSKLVFDCQENFTLNLLHQKIYPKWKTIWFGLLYSNFVRFVDGWVDRVWFAEKVYEAQMPDFIGKARTFENKVSNAFHLINARKPINVQKHLLFSGVVTSESGGMRAMEFLNQWVRTFPDWKASIIGYCPDNDLKFGIKVLADTAEIEYHLDNWISSYEIMERLENSQAVLMPYNESEANRGKIPTKFFEALYLGKPVLVQKGSYFADLASKYSAGIEVEFWDIHANDWTSIYAQIATYIPTSIYSNQYLFGSEGLRQDFLSLSGFGPQS